MLELTFVKPRDLVISLWPFLPQSIQGTKEPLRCITLNATSFFTFLFYKNFLVAQDNLPLPLRMLKQFFEVPPLNLSSRI